MLKQYGNTDVSMLKCWPNFKLDVFFNRFNGFVFSAHRYLTFRIESPLVGKFWVGQTVTLYINGSWIVNTFWKMPITVHVNDIYTNQAYAYFQVCNSHDYSTDTVCLFSQPTRKFPQNLHALLKNHELIRI